MRIILLPFSRRYIVLTIALSGTAALIALIFDEPTLGRYLALPLAIFGFFSCLACAIWFNLNPAVDGAIFA